MSLNDLSYQCVFMQKQQQQHQQQQQQHQQVATQKQSQWQNWRLQMQQQQQQQQQQWRELKAYKRRKCRHKCSRACGSSRATPEPAAAPALASMTATATAIKKANNNDRNYCNFNKINRLLIATSLLLITMATSTTAVAAATATSASISTAVQVPMSKSLIGRMVASASSPLSPSQQRQLQQQQLFALLTKNRQPATGGDVAAGAIASLVSGPEQHLLEVPVADDVDGEASLETAGFVADDGQQYEKAVKALAGSASANDNNNSNSNGNIRNKIGNFQSTTQTDCPKECKCLDAYFDCGDKRLDRIPNLPDYVRILDFVGNRFNDTTVLQIKNLTELIKLTLKRNQLESVPVFIGLTALKQLNLANNHIQRINSAALEALPKLKALDLSRNYLHTLESSYFPPNNRLAHLILNSNEIGSIDENALLNLGDLLDLELNNNRLMTLPAGVFGNLHKLRKLSLNNNHLEINWSTFRGLLSLQKLFLKSNNIRNLQDGLFYVMHAIETIELDHNHITSLSRQGLFNLTKLHHLSLSNNSISRIEPDTWEFTQSLISLDLSHNNISEFKPQHLDCLKRLRHLNLGHNKIQYLAETTFDCVKNLEELNLRRNKLAWIIEDQGAAPAFKTLRKLKKLDLYGNNLKQIMSKSLSGLSSLESLNLGGNALATIQSGAFDHMPHLQKLSFKSLNFICDCELLWFQRWLRGYAQLQAGAQVQAENAVCGYPEHLLNGQLLSLTVADLKCVDSPKPTILQEPSNQLTVKGANITMECIGNSPAAASLAAVDELKIKWRHDNQNVRERDRSSGHVFAAHHSGAGGGSYSMTETQVNHDQSTNQTEIIGYLRLYNVSYANAGRYQCVVSNAFGTVYSQKFKISIGIHPKFLQIPSNLTIDSGETARLVCSAAGDPMPEIALQKFGGSDFPAATERRLQVVREENAFIITNAKPADTGIYTCTAESAAGEIKVNATLIVNDKPQPEIPLVLKETAVGESSVLKCLSDVAADLNQPHREWFKDNKPLHLGTLSTDSERYFFTTERELLVIVNTQSVDAGHFRCEISDNSRTFTVQTELIVVKDDISQSVVICVVIVVVLCVLICSVLVFMLIPRRRRKSYNRNGRPNTRGLESGTSATGGLISSSGVGGIGGGARVASTSKHLLSESHSSALDQTQMTTLNRTFLQKPQEVHRQRPRSLADLNMSAIIANRNSGESRAAHNDGSHQQLIVTPTHQSYQRTQQDRGSVGNNSNNSGGGEHLTLDYLKRNSLHDGERNQDQMSSKDSGTGSDTAVKRSLDDFTLTTLLAPVVPKTPSPVSSSTPTPHRFNGGHTVTDMTKTYTSGDANGHNGGGDAVDDVDDAEILFAATHALGVSECDVELLELERRRRALPPRDNSNEPDDNADERTHFLSNSNYNRSSNYNRQLTPNSTQAMLHNPYTNYNNRSNSSHNFDGGGCCNTRDDDSFVISAQNYNAPSSKWSNATTQSTNLKINANATAMGGSHHTQAIDI